MFNGNGHQISNLTVPLFNTLSGATITSLNLSNVNISDVCGRVGAFAEEVYGTTFENCRVEGNIYSASSCSYKAGAFVGGCSGEGNSFEACSADVYINDEEQADFCGEAGYLGQ